MIGALCPGDSRALLDAIPLEGFMTNGKLSLIVASLAVATGLFGARMLISPPVSEAATNGGVDPSQMTRNAPTDLATFDSVYQRHTGVLDTLKVP